MSTCKRHGNKWSHNEVLSLHREYELLEWDLQKIADKHQRTVQSIIHKLYAEGITPTLLEEPSKKTGGRLSKKVNVVSLDIEEISDTDSSSDYEDCEEDDDHEDHNDVDKNVNNLSSRVWSLETSVNQISSMVKQMFDQMSPSSKKVRPHSNI
jgi:hypothetical protein